MRKPLKKPALLRLEISGDKLVYDAVQALSFSSAEPPRRGLAAHSVTSSKLDLCHPQKKRLWAGRS